MTRTLLVLVTALALFTGSCIVDLGPLGTQECVVKGYGSNHVDLSDVRCTPIAR